MDGIKWVKLHGATKTEEPMSAMDGWPSSCDHRGAEIRGLFF